MDKSTLVKINEIIDAKLTLDSNVHDKISKIVDTKLGPLVDKIAKIDAIESSLDFLSESYENLNKKVKNLSESNTLVDQENTRLGAKLRDTRNELEQIKETLNDMEQYIRRDCLEIRGVPLHKDEDTNEIVRKVGHIMDLDIRPEDISVSHRLPSRADSASSNNGSNGTGPSKDQKHQSIIVKFVRRDVRDSFYKSRKSLRNKSTKDLGYLRHQPQNVFVSESLTSRNHLLFNKCLQKRKELKYKFIWTHYGKILLRKDGSSPAICIKSEEDIKKIC